jgi:hypothetical protein
MNPWKKRGIGMPREFVPLLCQMCHARIFAAMAKGWPANERLTLMISRINRVRGVAANG